nr:putative ribonuclease H-like domain-containing protein [Tanacetum cinerariifolium]
AENQTNPHAGFQDTEKGREEGTQTYVLFPVLSDGSTNPKNNKDAHTDGKEHDDDIQNNGVNAVGSSVFAAELNLTNSTNDFSAAGPSNAAMPNLEDLSHNADDVGAEADINNMESIISVSLILTSRIHKDHPTSQIIESLDLGGSALWKEGNCVPNGRLHFSMTLLKKKYTYQPPGFEDPQYPDKVYKVVKALYGLHQAPRAWNETLATYLLENGF